MDYIVRWDIYMVLKMKTISKYFTSVYTTENDSSIWLYFVEW